LLRQFPDASVVGNPTRPRRGAYEVTLKAKDTEVLLWSKLQSASFPGQGELVKRIANYEGLLNSSGSIRTYRYAETKEAPTIEQSESWCTLF